MDALGAVIVGRWYDLDDLVTRELQARDVVRRACHEIAVQDTEYRFVGNDKEVILFAFELENARLETDCQIVV